MKIYLASSWRNLLQAGIVVALRKMGHEVYDFRHPDGPDSKGFAWSDIDPGWQTWTPDHYRHALEHPIAKAGFERDMRALDECDACVMVLPCGRSANWEFGYACGEVGKAIVLTPDP